MKKILLALFALFVFCCTAQAKTPVNFVYIHGSDQGTVEEFDVWIHRMHPDMQKNLSDNKLFTEKELKDAYIKDEPQMIYWADKTQKGRAAVTHGLSISSKESTALSNLVRSIIAYMLHDVIWLQKYSNLKPILDDVNKVVIENSKKGEKTVLVGYSAGTLITYQYFLNKSRYLNPVTFLRKHQKELKISDEGINYVKTYANGTTCIDAFIDSGIAFMNADGGLMLNPDAKQRKNNVQKLNKQTELSCAPENYVLGVVNFGSPLVVFYSDITENESQISYFTRKLGQDIIEKGQFYLTVNYKKDPIAVPMDNVNFEKAKQMNPDTNKGEGFVYQTLINGGRNVAAAHLRYWDDTNNYTKAVAKSYEQGYKLFYGIKE